MTKILPSWIIILLQISTLNSIPTCLLCPPGEGSVDCTQCAPCPPSHFSSHPSTTPCSPCSRCDVTTFTLAQCTATSDVTCVDCDLAAEFAAERHIAECDRKQKSVDYFPKIPESSYVNRDTLMRKNENLLAEHIGAQLSAPLFLTRPKREVDSGVEALLVNDDDYDGDELDLKEESLLPDSMPHPQKTGYDEGGKSQDESDDHLVEDGSGTGFDMAKLYTDMFEQSSVGLPAIEVSTAMGHLTSDASVELIDLNKEITVNYDASSEFAARVTQPGDMFDNEKLLLEGDSLQYATTDSLVSHYPNNLDLSSEDSSEVDSWEESREDSEPIIIEDIQPTDSIVEDEYYKRIRPDEEDQAITEKVLDKSNAVEVGHMPSPEKDLLTDVDPDKVGEAVTVSQEQDIPESIDHEHQEPLEVSPPVKKTKTTIIVSVVVVVTAVAVIIIVVIVIRRKRSKQNKLKLNDAQKKTETEQLEKGKELEDLSTDNKSSDVISESTPLNTDTNENGASDIPEVATKT